MTRDEARDYIAGHGFDPELPGQQGIARFAQEQITRLVNGGGPEHFSDYERAMLRAEFESLIEAIEVWTRPREVDDPDRRPGGER